MSLYVWRQTLACAPSLWLLSIAFVPPLARPKEEELLGGRWASGITRRSLGNWGKVRPVLHGEVAHGTDAVAR